MVWPKSLTSREDKQVERRNDAFFALCRRFREENMSRKAVDTAMQMCGWGPTRVFERSRGCAKAG